VKRTNIHFITYINYAAKQFNRLGSHFIQISQGYPTQLTKEQEEKLEIEKKEKQKARQKFKKRLLRRAINLFKINSLVALIAKNVKAEKNHNDVKHEQRESQQSSYSRVEQNAQQSTNPNFSSRAAMLELQQMIRKASFGDQRLENLLHNINQQMHEKNLQNTINSDATQQLSPEQRLKFAQELMNSVYLVNNNFNTMRQLLPEDLFGRMVNSLITMVNNINDAIAQQLTEGRLSNAQMKSLKDNSNQMNKASSDLNNNMEKNNINKENIPNAAASLETYFSHNLSAQRKF
jgi:hypothetical protein